MENYAYYEKWKIMHTMKNGRLYQQKVASLTFNSQQTKVKSEPHHILDCQIILQNHSPIPGRG